MEIRPAFLVEFISSLEVFWPKIKGKLLRKLRKTIGDRF
jgi:hypothetical protein